MFDPLSLVCLTCVSAPYRPQARYTFLASAWLEEALFNTIRLHMHEHKQCNVDMAYSHASILLCSHSATTAAVYEQNDSIATKFVNWWSRSLCCSPLCCIVNDALRWHKATCEPCYDSTMCVKEVTVLRHGWDYRAMWAQASGGPGRRNISGLAQCETTGLVGVRREWSPDDPRSELCEPGNGCSLNDDAIYWENWLDRGQCVYTRWSQSWT